MLFYLSRSSRKYLLDFIMSRSTKKRSTIWEFCTKKSDNSVVCTICRKEFKYSGNTSNLRDHLRRKHPGYLESNVLQQEQNNDMVFVEQENKDASENAEPEINANSANKDTESISNELPTPSTSSSGSLAGQDNSGQKRTAQKDTTCTTRYKKPRQTKLFLADKRTSLNDSEIETIDKGLIKMIALDYQPLSLVENTGFINYSKLLQPLYQLPSRKTLSTKLIPNAYNKIRTQLTDVLTQVKYVSITTDIWTSDSNRAYMSVTSHFTFNNKIMNCVLNVKEIPVAHTGQNISSALLDCFNEWGINEKIVTIVSDNGANVKSAIVQHLQKRHHPCVAHTLNLCVTDSLNAKDQDKIMEVVKPLLSKCKAIVGHFKHSVTACEKLKTMQQQMKLPELKVIQDVSTRWNSTLHMIERLLLIREPLSAVVSSLPKGPTFLSATEWEILGDWVPILKPIEKMTIELSGEQYPTMSMIIPLVRGLQHALKNIPAITPSGLTLKSLLMQNISNRLAILESNSICGKATFLDPRFKKAGFGFADNADTIQEGIERELASMSNTEVIIEKPSTVTEAISNNSSEKSIKEFDIWTHFDEKVSQIKTVTTPATIAKLAVRQYLELPLIGRSEDPMLFWNRHQISMPEIYELYKKYSSVPATSVPSERLFSKSGEITNDRRNRTSPKNLDAILFLNSNILKFEF